MIAPRLDRLRSLLDREGLDGLWVSSVVDDIFHRHSQNRRYLSGFTGSTGGALVTSELAIMAVDPRYTSQATGQTAARGFAVHEMKARLAEWLPILASEHGLGGKRIGVSASDMTLAAYEGLQEAVAEMEAHERPELLAAPPLVEELRRLKEPDELAAIQRAIDIADAACDDVLGRVQPGMTELQVSDMVTDSIRIHGGEGPSFATIAAGGPWSAQPHASPRPEPLRAGEPLIVDMGVLVDGYISDLTRTIPVGGELSARFREVYELVLAAQMTAIEGVRAGMPGDEAHALAMGVFERAGQEDFFVHGLGHGVGLEVHEYPHLGRMSEDTLDDGMVFTIEPGLYYEDWGGVRIEDIVVLTNGSARVLSGAPKLNPREG